MTLQGCSSGARPAKPCPCVLCVHACMHARIHDSAVGSSAVPPKALCRICARCAALAPQAMASACSGRAHALTARKGMACRAPEAAPLVQPHPPVPSSPLPLTCLPSVPAGCARVAGRMAPARAAQVCSLMRAAPPACIRASRRAARWHGCAGRRACALRGSCPPLPPLSPQVTLCRLCM